MQLSVRAFSLAAAIVGAVAASLTAILAMLIPSWGVPLMDSVAVVMPGVTGADWRSLLVLAVYLAVDGFVFGGVFAWLYNRLRPREPQR